MENGDIPKAHHPRAAVIMIGTNDLGAAQGCSGGDAKKILETAQGVKSRSTSAAKQQAFPPQTNALTSESMKADAEWALKGCIDHYSRNQRNNLD